MKKLAKTLFLSTFILIGLISVGCSDKNTGLTGETLVDEDYAKNLLPMISMYVKIEAVPDCKNVEIINTKISKKPTGDKEKIWEELWTLNACGKTVEIPLQLKDSEGRIQTFITSQKMQVK